MKLIARTTGVFYLLNIVAILLSISVFRGSAAAMPLKVISTACSIVVAALLYEILRPVNEPVSLVAAFFRLTACAVALVGYVYQPASRIVIILFGFHFIPLGYLISRSGFLPRWLGRLVAVVGVCCLVFLAPALGTLLFPYFVALGLVAELSLTACLLLTSEHPTSRNIAITPKA